MIIGIDMDEVIADLHTPWAKWISGLPQVGLDGSPPFTITEFKYWTQPNDLGKSWGFDPYTFLTAENYENLVKPLPLARAAFQRLQERGHRTLVVTSCPNPKVAEAKRLWLTRYGFTDFIDTDWFVATEDKSKVPCHALVDDYHNNLTSFPGLRVMVTRLHNVNIVVPGALRVRSLYEFASLL